MNWECQKKNLKRLVMILAKKLKNVPICAMFGSGKMLLQTIPELELTDNVISPDITDADKKRIAKVLEREYNEEILSVDIDWSNMQVQGIDVL